MTVSRQALCVAYGLIALLALIATWGQNIHYLSLGFVGANQRFWLDTLVNPASRSITADILFLFVAVSIWMLGEARRLGMKAAWLYVVLGALVAISVTFPLFMLRRELALATRDGDAPAMSLLPAERVLLGLSMLTACAYGVMALMR